MGEYESRTTHTGFSWIKRMDIKPVYFLSNYHDPSEVSTVNRRQKDGSLKSKPVHSAGYKNHMDYVDYADQLILIYKIHRKTKK